MIMMDIEAHRRIRKFAFLIQKKNYKAIEINFLARINIIVHYFTIFYIIIIIFI
jgi:hypothetical protein